MSAVQIPFIYLDKEYLKGLIGSVFKDDPDYLKGLIKSLYKEDSEIRDIIHAVADEIIVKEHEIPKRLAGVEQATGLADYELEGEEHKVTLVERVSKLEAHVLTEEPIQKTKMEKRAEFFMKVPPQGKFTLAGLEIKSKDWRNWVKTLPEELRAKSSQNIRKLKIDLFRLLKKLFPDRVYISKGKGRNGEWKLILKSVT